MKVSMYILITGNNLITEPNEYVCNPSLSQIKVFFWRLSVVLALVDHKMSVSIFKIFDKYIGDKPHKYMYCDIHIVYAFTSTIQWFVVICIQDQKVANISRR